jgi:hypothetical protein
MTRRLVVACCALLLLGACGGDQEGGTPVTDPPDQVTGVILEIESVSLGDVTSFTLKADDTEYEIFIADDVDYGFALSHLQEHLTSAEPVAVDLELRDDDRLYALTIEDA